MILSSQLVVRYCDEGSKAAHRIGPDFRIASFSDPSTLVVECMTSPVLKKDIQCQKSVQRKRDRLTLNSELEYEVLI